MSLPSIMQGPVTGNSELVERGLWKLRIPLYGSSFRGTWQRGSFAMGTEGYERKALEMGISPHGGSVGQPGVGSSTGDFEIWLKGALGVECPSHSLSLSVEAL